MTKSSNVIQGAARLPSNVIQGAARLPGESWDDYKKRRVYEQEIIYRWLKGRPHDNSTNNH